MVDPGDREISLYVSVCILLPPQMDFPPFVRMRSCGSALESRLEAITGDISVPGFGLDEQDLK